MRQKLVWMEWDPNVNNFAGGVYKPANVDEEPDRVWTLFLPDHETQDKPPTLPVYPVHNKNAFLEGYVHDWNWHNGKFRFYTRVNDRSCWVLLEYEDNKELRKK